MKPIGNLPPRRDQLIEAKEAAPRLDEAIVAPKAQDRLLELIEREQLPGDVRDTLAGALSGDLRRQQLLFQAMLDTWPRLQKNLKEVMREVKKAPWELKPFAARGEEPTDSATDKTDFAEDAIWNMRPRRAYGEMGTPGLIEALGFGYFAGHHVVEVRWQRTDKGIVPRAAKNVSPRFYGYPSSDEEEDRLMFDPDGGFLGYHYEDFPPHRFLLAINTGHPGHPSIAAPLRALTGYWLAATFGLKWLLQFAQLYGVPFRWATYADETSRAKVCNMLETIGSAGWGAFPAGTKVDFIDASKSAKDVPQRDLVDLADKQCDIFILGQTLTSDVGDSGSRALGDVHQDVRAGVISGVADFVADVINEQLIPSIIKLNYGNRDELPTIAATFEKPKDEGAMAQRDQILFAQMGLPVEKGWLYERHGIPQPDGDSEDIFQPLPNGVQGELVTSREELGHETKGRLEAADNPGEMMSTIDRLSANVLEELTGVTKEWLAPVRPFFERLVALAMSKNVTDEDFAEALLKAQKELPELFDRLNTEALEESLGRAIGTAMLAGSVKRYEGNAED